ncbi:MAG: hypothetical protein ACR2OZ_13575 [Verrucomicrobiales bacterium]
MNAPLRKNNVWLAMIPGLVRTRWLRVVAWILIVIPPSVAARLIADHQVNIPFLDDWMFTPMYEKAARGELTINDLFVVQMEHRLAVPRLILVALYYLAPGAFALQNWITFGLLVFIGFNVAVLFRRTGLRFSQRWLPMLLMSVTLFSPVLYQILLWPMMFQVVLPVASLTAALAIVGAGSWPLWVRFAGCVVCALTATLSFASGLLVWPLLLVAILFERSVTSRARKVFAVLWLAAAAITALLYFHDLRNSTDPSFAYGAAGGEDTASRGASAVWSSPLGTAAFVIRVLGSPFGRGTSASMMAQALWTGLISVAVLGGVSVLFWLRRRQLPEPGRLAPWWLLAAYSVGTATMIAAGRMWATRSGDNALTPRYIIHALPFALSVIALLAVCWHWLRSRHSARREPLAAGAGAAVAVFLTWQWVLWVHGAAMMNVWESARLRGAAHTLFFKLRDRVDLKGEVAGMTPLARRMDDLGLLRPPMLTDTNLNQFRVSRNPPTRSSNRFASLSQTQRGKYRFKRNRAAARPPAGRRRRIPHSRRRRGKTPHISGLPGYADAALPWPVARPGFALRASSRRSARSGRPIRLRHRVCAP